MHLRGIFPPLTTPFDSHGEVDREALRQNLLKYGEFGLAGYVVLGSNGESVYLTLEERLQVLETARLAVPAEKVLMAGVFEESTRGCIDFLRQIGRLGLDAAMVGVPHYFKGQMTAEVIFDHYQRVADSAPLPILLYNVPQFTGIRIPVDVIAKLLGHPRIVGMKDSSGDLGYDQEILQLTEGRDFQILTGSASALLPGLVLGIQGGVIAIACALPDLPIEICRLWAANLPEARGIQRVMFPLSRAVTEQFGLAGLKYLMDLAGFRGGLPRLPLRPLREEQKVVLQELLKRSGRLAAHAASSPRS
jgi:4-hydroxy-2-oxoglutarate aldolase